MPAGITTTDTMFSVRETPWHGLGAVLDQPPATIVEAIELSGLGWTVEKEPIAVDRAAAAADDFTIPRWEEIPDYYATVRQDTRDVLGIVGPRYEVVQNEVAFEFVDQLLGSSLHFETAGSLHGGRRVWVLATLPNRIEVGGDAVRPFVLLSNSHDGSSALLAATTPVRVVCQNTLSISVSRAHQKMALRHTGDIRRRVHEARRVLDLAVDYYAQFQMIGNQLASERCTERQLGSVLDELYPSGTADTTMTDRTRRSREDTKQRITELFLRGDTVGNAPGSKWVALNAVVEHMDWRPVRGGTERFARTIDSTAAKTKVLELITAV